MTTLEKKQTAIEKLLSQSNFKDNSFTEEFNNIIINHIDGYDGKPKDRLKSFFDDLQRGGCMSGLIGEFIYNSDCKTFYIAHIDDLEDMKEELESQIGEPIANRHQSPHYVFMCHLCFEEYCYDLYRTIFED